MYIYIYIYQYTPCSYHAFSFLHFFLLQDEVTLAYQIAFDLYESASQHFLGDVIQGLKSSIPSGMNVSENKEISEEQQKDGANEVKPAASSDTPKVALYFQGLLTVSGFLIKHTCSMVSL